MNENLVTMNQMQNEIRIMKKISMFLSSAQRKILTDLEKQLDNMIAQISMFNDRFSSYGWCTYDRINLPLIEKANAVFEERGIDAAEQILIEYYKSDVREIIQWIRNSSESFKVRDDLIQRFFEDHFAGRYHASVPLGLIIIDGAVNDYTKSKGFFAEGTKVEAWDCLVGCSDGLSKLKEMFNQKRTKTNTEKITLPYRNGILHGRDINYANEYVSCKCVALMFAVADWMIMKDSEDERRDKYEKKSNPPPLKESISRLLENRQIRKEIASWEKRTITVGKDIPASGSPEDYIEYPYISKVVEMLFSWKQKNYGELAVSLKNMFSENLSPGKRAGECRKIFEHKTLDSFELIEIEERACALSRIVVKVCWTTNGLRKCAMLTFGCVYEGNTERVSVPWRDNGEWVIMPWDLRELYE